MSRRRVEQAGAGLTSGTSAEAGRRIFDPILERLLIDLAINRERKGVHLRPVSREERPFSHIMRVAICRDKESEADTHAFIKVFKSKPDDGGVEKMRRRVAHEFETTRRIHEAMMAHRDIGTVRPLACYPDCLALVTEEAPGQTLLAHLQQHAGWFPSGASLSALIATLETTGRWIRTFQAVEPMPGRVSLGDLRGYIDLRLERLVREPLAHFSREDRRRLLEHIDALSADVHPGHLREVLVHADLSLGNVLVDGPRIVVLDFAMAHGGNVLQDITRLLVQIDLLSGKPQFRRHVIERLQAALLRGFDPDLSPRAPLFRLMLLQHRVNHLATLSAQRAAFPVNLYHAHLRRLHRAWITRELRHGASAGEAG